MTWPYHGSVSQVEDKDVVPAFSPSFNFTSPIRHPFQQLIYKSFSEDDGLLPDIPSWGTLLDLEMFQPEPRSIPRDVVRPDGEMAWDERPIAVDVIDPTSLGVAFDRSVLDALDDQLLLHPNDSFADVCWGDAVHDMLDRAATPTQLQIDTGLYPAIRRRPSQDSEDSFSDDDPSTPIFEKEPVDSDEFKITQIYPGFLPTFLDQLDDYYDDQTSFMNLDPAFTVSNPQDSVNYFPIPVRNSRTRLPTRFISFCSKIPARLKGSI